MKRLLPLALAVLTACSSHTVVVPPTCPPPAAVTVTITPGQIGTRYLVEFATAPATYTVCGQLPPGLTVSVVNGQLWLSGTPTKPGTYQFSIAQQ
jgi:hypothetical protein